MTIKNKEDKELIVDKLLITKRKGHNLEIDLMFKEMEADAKKVKTKTNKLSKKVDSLLAALMQDWIGSAKLTIESIKKTNENLQKTIRDIKKDVEVAKNIVKAIGYLDDVIMIAANLLA
jgi:DNA integrity scanning protein DisA with diadenylate cyclase activity